jgi:hypothetical protein
MSTLRTNNILTTTNVDITPRFIKIADTGVVSTGQSITIDNCFSTTYSRYVVDFYSIGTTNESSIFAFCGRSGSSDIGSFHNWRRYRNYTGHTVNEIDSATVDSAVSMTYYSRSDNGVHGQINLYMPAHTNTYTYFHGNFLATHPNNAIAFPHVFDGSISTTTAVTGIRFFGRSGWTGSFSYVRMVVYAHSGM